MTGTDSADLTVLLQTPVIVKSWLYTMFFFAYYLPVYYFRNDSRISTTIR